MKALNYFRDALKHFKKDGKGSLVPDIATVLDRGEKAQKFILPNFGRIFDDQLRALPNELKLPYPIVVLEYLARSDDGEKRNGYAETLMGEDRTEIHGQRIIIATQTSDDEIIINCISFVDRLNEWFFQPFQLVLYAKKTFNDEHNAMDFHHRIDPLLNVHLHTPDWETQGMANMADELRAVLEFLEALSCKNINATRVPVDRKANNLARLRGAKPFDVYHILTVDTAARVSEGNEEWTDGDRSRPREHLRMGHARHYKKSGIKLWIQSMIINAGVGGKVTKDYRIE